MGSLDYARNVRHREGAEIGQLYDPQVWGERRERVIRHLRPCLRHSGQKGRLACVGLSDEPYVGDQLELDLHPALFAGPPWLPPDRCLFRGCHEMRVPPSTPTPLGDHDPVARHE